MSRTPSGRVRNISFGSLVPILIGACIALGSCSRDDEASVPRFETRNWNATDSTVWVRAGAAHNGILIWCMREEQSTALAHQYANRSSLNFESLPTPDRSIYQWTPGGAKLTIETRLEWSAATGNPFDENGTHGRSLQRSQTNTYGNAKPKLQLDRPTKRQFGLLKDGKPVQTRAAYVLAACKSPTTASTVAVLSATRLKSVGGILGGGVTTFGGPYYHELYDMQTGDRVGQPVRLNDSKDIDDMGMSWDGEGRHVVYFERAHQHLWVVDTNSQHEEAVQSKPPEGTETPKADGQPTTVQPQRK